MVWPPARLLRATPEPERPLSRAQRAYCDAFTRWLLDPSDANRLARAGALGMVRAEAAERSGGV